MGRTGSPARDTLRTDIRDCAASRTPTDEAGAAQLFELRECVFVAGRDALAQCDDARIARVECVGTSELRRAGEPMAGKILRLLVSVHGGVLE
jgi:hypothetical protein